MSGASVVVLAPNGRRQTVKCTPNTTVLQIIEEVCRKQGFSPEEYDVKHHSKVLDTSATFRFSGLPNNAQLELVAAAKNRTESDITLAVNLENGNRLTDIFKPNDTLLEVLKKVCPENAAPDKNPVVIYTRREIYGSELEKCTLRSLGLTGGRAMLRVLNKDPELLKQQANISAPLPSKPVEEKPYIRKFQPLEKDVESNVIEPTKEKNEPEPTKENNEPEPPPMVKEFKVEPKKDILKLAKETYKRRKSCENEPQIPMEIDSTETKAKHTETEFVFCGQRDGMIFSLATANAIPVQDIPDDFFELTIDDAKKILKDVKQRQFELENQMLRTSQQRQFEETKKQLRQLNKYKKTIIRVQLPDRTVIQGTFKPTETIQDVLDFVKSYLEDEDLDFYIYSTPPKCILNLESRLLETGCVPGALLYFGTKEDKKDGFLKKEFEVMFTTNSIASLAAAKIRQENTRNDTNEIQDDFMETSDSFDVNSGASTSTAYTEDLQQPKVERKKSMSDEKLPKWFKPL